MSEAGNAFQKLVEIIAKLRDPNGGCPWDLEQTHETLKQYAIEEAYEVVDAIDAGPEKLKGELGDLLLQVLLHSQIARDNGTFTISEVVTLLTEKLIKRHPHVFGEVKADTTKEVLKNWEQIKQKDLKENESVLDGVPRSMPALLRAQRIGSKAARVGFDWNDTEGVLRKIEEEVGEFLTALKDKSNAAHITEEFGDLLFAIAQLARKLHLDAEESLTKATQKFQRRFQFIEQKAGKELKNLSPEELDKLWEEAKLHFPNSSF